ncbi:MAG: hypothetical protein K2N65_03935 [Anaeroplasmataceae bacterium]|nr:hypothetical protein [Anaeroplasmataceae bacterium]
MNKVSERCAMDKHAKFYYASKRLFTELKIIRVILYALAIIPVVITMLPLSQSNPIYPAVCTVISFAITLINEAMGSFTSRQKDIAIYSLQVFETGVTGSTFSKIEYDRELTNELNELAIRRGLSAIQKLEDEERYTISVPKDISDEYSYLYICRINAATNKYLLSRMIYIYLFILIAIVTMFICAMFFNNEEKTTQFLVLIIGFWPLISPIIKDFNSAKECVRDCTKVCADIDNYFADGDASVERLARMHYYVQQIEFEMYSSRPTIYKLFKIMFSHGVEVLHEGVTDRFRSSIVELKQKSLMNKGLISQPKGKGLITQKEYDLEKLKKIEKEKKVIKVTKPVVKSVETKPTQKPTSPAPAKPASKSSPAKPAVKTVGNKQAPAATKKTTPAKDSKPASSAKSASAKSNAKSSAKKKK